MSRSYKTVFNRCLGVWQVASELTSAKGKATKGGTGGPPVLLNKKILVQAISSAILLVGATSSMYAHGDTTIGSGSVSSGLNVAIGSTTNIYVDSGGSISSPSNGVYNGGGTIFALSNNGVIFGTSTGINNAIGYSSTSYAPGTIDTLNNNVGATISGGSFAINNLNSVIGTLSNSGLISSNQEGIANTFGLISLLENNSGGTITGAVQAISNSGTIGALLNSGLITGTSSIGSGIYNDNGTISLIQNNIWGTISGSAAAIQNNSSAAIGQISNSGLIAGNIINASSNALTITGSNIAGTFGTLTGYSGGIGASDIGTITNTLSNLSFASGNILLNDHINVGSNTVMVASGANLAVSNLVTITGNYDQYGTLTSNVSDAAVVNGNFSSDSGYGRLFVTGAATLETGAAVVLAKTNYAFVSGQRFVVIEGNSSSSYATANSTFSATGYSGTVTASQVADGSYQALVLTLTGDASSSGSSSAGSSASTGLATTPVAISSLKGLTNYGGIANGLLDLYDAALAIDSTGEANRIGAQLAPTQNFSSGNATSTATFDALSVVGVHVDAVRLASVNSGVATGESTVSWAAWGQLYGGHAHQGMVDSVSGYTSTYGGLVLGADRALGDRWRTGGAFSYNNTAIYGSDYLTGNASHVNSYGLIGYASYTGEPWYVNLSASATLQKYNTSRVVALTGFYGEAEGSFNGTQYVAKAEFGYPLALRSDITATPIAALSYSYQKQNAYTESGGNGAALSVDGTHTNALRSSLGGKIEKSLETGYGALVPFVQLMWTHQYNAGRTSTSASYVADTTGATGFTITGAAPERNIGELRLGANLLRSDNMSISLRYDLQAASSYLSQALSLRLRKLF